MVVVWNILPGFVDSFWTTATLVMVLLGPFLVVRPSLRTAGSLLSGALVLLAVALSVEFVGKMVAPLVSSGPAAFVDGTSIVAMFLVALAALRARSLRTPHGSVELLRHEGAVPSELPVVRSWQLSRSQGACRWPSVLGRTLVIEAGEIRQRSDGHLEIGGWAWEAGGTGVTVLAAALLSLIGCLVSPAFWLVLPIVYFGTWLLVHRMRRRRLTIDLATADRIAIDRTKQVVAIRFASAGQSLSYSARLEEGIETLEAAIGGKYPRRFDPLELERVADRGLLGLAVVLVLLALISFQAMLIFPMRW
ncbi:MAG TPA: hypothetical protein DCQ98_22395 [Planctomycetaceae bacterium]|nr:hypothetical protein [Planctomycetaceae bacterium]HRF02042.1 hypothetical protein [Pirellulaceae bacterium]